jgi:hypothetical protein
MDSFHTRPHPPHPVPRASGSGGPADGRRKKSSLSACPHSVCPARHSQDLPMIDDTTKCTRTSSKQIEGCKPLSHRSPSGWLHPARILSPLPKSQVGGRWRHTEAHPTDAIQLPPALLVRNPPRQTDCWWRCVPSSSTSRRSSEEGPAPTGCSMEPPPGAGPPRPLAPASRTVLPRLPGPEGGLTPGQVSRSPPSSGLVVYPTHMPCISTPCTPK